MSDTVKLIIDIPEDTLKEMNTEEFISIESINTAIECIKNGTPLDDIKAEIEELETYDGIYIDRYYVLEILDNIGKKESEE